MLGPMVACSSGGPTSTGARSSSRTCYRGSASSATAARLRSKGSTWRLTATPRTSSRSPELWKAEPHRLPALQIRSERQAGSVRARDREVVRAGTAVAGRVPVVLVDAAVAGVVHRGVEVVALG